MAYHVRILTEQDIDLYPDRFKATEWTIEAMAEKDARDLIASPHDDILMALDERDTFAGMVHCRIQKNGHEVHLQQVFVAPEFRGRGAADFLMESAQRWAEERGLTTASLMVAEDNPPALKVYKRNGYQPVTTNFNTVAGPSGATIPVALITADDWAAYDAFQKNQTSSGVAVLKILTDQKAFPFYDGRYQGNLIFKNNHKDGSKSFAQINLYTRGEAPDCLMIEALFLSPEVDSDQHIQFLRDIRSEIAARFDAGLPIYADLEGENPKAGDLLKKAGYTIGGYFMVKNLDRKSPSP